MRVKYWMPYEAQPHITSDLGEAKGGVTEDGELMFFEIKDSLRPILNGKNKYQRVIIGRLFPCVKVEEENDKEE